MNKSEQVKRYLLCVTSLFFSASSYLLCDHPLLRDWLPLPLNIPAADQF